MKAIISAISRAVGRLKRLITGTSLPAEAKGPRRQRKVKVSKGERALAAMTPDERVRAEERRAKRLARETAQSAMPPDQRADRERKRADRKSKMAALSPEERAAHQAQRAERKAAKGG